MVSPSAIILDADREVSGCDGPYMDLPGRVGHDDRELAQYTQIEGPDVTIHPLGLEGDRTTKNEKEGVHLVPWLHSLRARIHLPGGCY